VIKSPEMIEEHKEEEGGKEESEELIKKDHD
jgi:hypothetical protein